MIYHVPMALRRRTASFFYKQNRPQQLRGFFHVAFTGSFSAAAKKMGLCQPAVSLQVQALERELDVLLFHRRSGAVVLTAEGEALLEIAAPIVRALETFDDAYRERLGRMGPGQVTCATTDNMVAQGFPRLLDRFNAQYPRVELVLHACSSSKALQMVERGDADLGFGMLDSVPRHCEFRPLAGCDYYVVVPRNHPLADRDALSLEDAAKWPIIEPVEQCTHWQSIHRRFAKFDLRPQVVMRAASTMARLRCVEAGLGVTIASAAEIPAEWARGLVWISLSDDLPRPALGLITRRGGYLSVHARRLSQFLIESMPAFVSNTKKDMLQVTANEAST